MIKLKKFQIFILALIFVALLIIFYFIFNNKKSPVKIEPIISQTYSCENICNSISNTCPDITKSLCLKMCPSWDDSQKKCINNSNDCNQIYNNCNIVDNFSFEPELNNECALACNNFIEKCDINSDRPKNIEDYLIYDDCLEDCKDWSASRITCVKESSCLDILTACDN